MSAFVDLRGRRFEEPFRCLCCDIEVSGGQFEGAGGFCDPCSRGQCHGPLHEVTEKGVPYVVPIFWETGHGRERELTAVYGRRLPLGIWGSE